jgi:hypothetical protein
VEEPVVTPEEAAEAMNSELEEAEPCVANSLIAAWLLCISNGTKYKDMLCRAWKFGLVPSRDSYPSEKILCDRLNRVAQSAKDAGISLAKFLAVELKYGDKVRKALTPSYLDDDAVLYTTAKHLPVMEDYAFFGKGQRRVSNDYDEAGLLGTGENPFEEDLMGLLSLLEMWDDSVRNLEDVLPESLLEYASEVNPPDDEVFVGHIRQIPKPGTVVRRSIADPNKFLQAGIAPYRKFLRSMTSRIPRNCQFNQNRFDKEISDRLNTGGVGSVDLHQSTDWMPLTWFHQIEHAFYELWYPLDREEKVFNDRTVYLYPRLMISRNLFLRMCDSQWDNEGLVSTWRRGQPLGTLPSFEILTITHYAILESLSWWYGRLDSPYALLGDDVVIFDPQIRQGYIEQMEAYGSPLSLHKSYSGRLTEFAGKIFVKNQKYRYCSDIPYLGWSNLFDYQRATGVHIHYADLPQKIKARFERHCNSEHHSSLRPEDLYIAGCYIADVPGLTHMTKVIGDLLVSFYQSEPKLEPEPTTGLYGFVAFGSVGTYDEERILPTIRLRKEKECQRKKAKWWTKKVRPESTTSIIERLMSHYSDLIGEETPKP